MDPSTDDDPGEEWVRSLFRKGRWPITRRDGINVVRLPDPEQFARLLPVPRLLFLVFLLALKDRASAIHFEAGSLDAEGRDIRMVMVVDGEPYELVPPPRILADVIIRELEGLAGLDSLRHRLAALLRRLAGKLDARPPSFEQGRFGLSDDRTRVVVTLKAYRTELYVRVYMEFGFYSNAFSDRAGEYLRELMASRRKDRRGGPEFGDP